MNWQALMGEAIELALRGRGTVEPNPRVGALCLQGEQVVGRGWHSVYGGPHAEVHALREAKARGAAPDTVVVTLEPCSSKAGTGGKKTPPCTEALLEVGVSRVVVGAEDPDPRHRGGGLRELAGAGVEVIEGVLSERCREINRTFERWLTLDRPWTICKWAMSLDGKTAAVTGESRWISGRESRRRVHALRAACDAVVVGIRTVQQDDPELTVREVEGPQPVRIAVDPGAELDDDSRLVLGARQIPTWLLVRQDAEPLRTGHLQDLGVQVIHVPELAGSPGRLDLQEAWRELRRRGLRRLLVEGGGRLTDGLLEADAVDQVLAFVAPRILGGQDAPTPVAGAGCASPAEALALREFTWDRSGEDLALSAFVY